MVFTSMSLLTYMGVGTSLILACIYLYFKYSFTYWKKLGVPYVKPDMLYGSFQPSITLKKSMGDLLQEWYFTYKAKGMKFVGAYFFHQPVFIPIDTYLIKNMLAQDFQNFKDRGMYHNEENDPLSAHLFSLNGMKWKNLRQKLTPTFSSGKLKQMFHTLVECSKELKNCLNELISKSEPVDIKKFLVKYTTDVVGSCAFGIDCNSFKDSDTEFIRIGAKVFQPSFLERMKSFVAFLFPSFAKYIKLRQTNKEVDVFFRKLVKDTMEYREKNNVIRNDFMQLLMQLKNKDSIEDSDMNKTDDPTAASLTTNEIAAQAFLFFVAGFETSSTTMAFCLYDLACNIEIQKKTRTEIINVLKKHNGKVTYDAIMEMHYMEKVINESLRLHVPIPLLQRVVTKDYKIPDTDIVLQKNTIVLFPVMGLHADPEYYPEPEKFDPDRFNEENKYSRPDFTHLPFGDGPRNCIGLRFGLMQTKVGLCQLISNYKFTLNPKTDDPIVLDPNSFVSCAISGIWLNAEKVTM